jgi:hypothetical protein
MMRKETKIGAAALAMMLAAVIGLPVLDAAAQTAPQAAPAQEQQVPEPDEGGVNWKGAGYGTGALLGNVLYIPAKLVYAAGGGLTGGLAYLVTGGNKQNADTIWRSSLGGDYVLTPDMVAGKQPVNFSGPTATPPETPPPAQQQTSSGAGSMAQTGGSGMVAPIAPIPPTTSSAQPLDSGSGPSVPPSMVVKSPDTSIE